MPRFLISADNHVNEPMELWRSLPEHLQPLAPRFEARDGAAQALIEETVVGTFKLPDDFDDGGDFHSAITALIDSTMASPGSNDPATRLRDLDTDGIWGEVMFPNNLVFMLYRLSRPELQIGMCRLYNDWLADRFIGESARFAPVATLPVLDIQATVAEIERVARRGFRAVLLPAHTDTLEYSYNDPAYEPIWAAAADHSLPITFHAGSGRPHNPARGPGGAVINYVLTVGGPKETATILCASGALARHPNLRVVMTECGSGWLAWMLHAMDDAYREHELWVKPKLDRLPSEYFREQGAVTFQSDPVGFHNVPFTGDLCLMWGADYPHPEGTWPNSAEYLETQLQGVPDHTVERVLWQNAAAVFKFEVPAAAAVAAG